MNIIFMLLLGCADTTKIEEKLSAIETKLAEKPKERVIVDYKIVTHIQRGNQTTDKLSEEVKALMKEGWQPLGGVNYATTTNAEFRHYEQTMVKYK